MKEDRRGRVYKKGGDKGCEGGQGRKADKRKWKKIKCKERDLKGREGRGTWNKGERQRGGKKKKLGQDKKENMEIVLEEINWIEN